MPFYAAFAKIGEASPRMGHFPAAFRKGKASLVQLDLTGALDRVHHGALLVELERASLPPPPLKWLDSYLSERTAGLTFDGKSIT